MRLLIVDDEPHIVDWLHDLMRSEFPDMDVRKAYSGIQAREMLEKEKIELLISDIRMPKMTGLELMRLVREKWPSCRILFLTGYGEFDYVYTAIQQKGVRYLLKTEDDEVIVRAVREMAREAAEDNAPDGSVDADRRHGAVEAIRRGAPVDRAMLGILGLDGDAPVRLVFARSRGEDTSVLTKAAERILPGGAGRFAAVPLSEGEECWLIQHGAGESQVDLEACLAEALTAKGGGEAQLFLRSQPVPPAELSAAFRAWIRLCSGLPFGPGILSLDPSAQSGSRLDSQRRMTLIESMEFMLSRGENDRYLQSMDQLFSDLQRDERPDERQYTRIYIALMLQLISGAERASVSGGPSDGSSAPSFRSVDSFLRWPDAFSYLRGQARALLGGGIKREEDQTSLTDTLTEYIETHVSEPLSLTALAELIHYNPSYLSRIFKERMGINLNDYILQARMRKACVLLRESGDKIADVARKVGIRDARHFAKLFQRYVGVTPRAYREGKT